ncbi:MAG: hypothetical protein CMP51_03390 [Flavobacteriales bacterium]|nr:hypothetical protein [Flavobacteriales bacterium]
MITTFLYFSFMFIYNILFYAVLIILILYAIVFYIYGKFWRSYDKYIEYDIDEKHVSVVIAHRNDFERICSLISDLENQDCTNLIYELIIVDDHSEKTQLENLKNIISEKRWIKLVSLTDGINGKKNAMKLGVESSQGTIILSTDSDCRVLRSWVRTMVNFFHEKDLNVVCAPVTLIRRQGFFYIFQVLDFLSLVAAGGGSMNINKPIFCSGANIAFRKEIYEGISDSVFEDFATDDVSMINYINSVYSKSVFFLKHKEAIVSTHSNINLSSFIRQKIRWIHFAKKEKNIYSLIIAIVVFLANLLLFLSFIFLFFDMFSSVSILVFLNIVIVKWCIDYYFIKPVLSFFGYKHLAKYIFPFQIIYAIYSTVIVLLSYILKPKWKGREIH